MKAIVENFFLLILISFSCAKDMPSKETPAGNEQSDRKIGRVKIIKPDKEWQKILSPEQYRILRNKGTEIAFSGKYHDFKGKGTYICAACKNELFESESKFDSGTGWPSYFAPIKPGAVGTETDRSSGMERIEVHCSVCGGHLGHIFKDGPKPTGLRYCINSAALNFKSH